MISFLLLNLPCVCVSCTRHRNALNSNMSFQINPYAPYLTLIYVLSLLIEKSSCYSELKWKNVFKYKHPFCFITFTTVYQSRKSIMPWHFNVSFPIWPQMPHNVLSNKILALTLYKVLTRAFFKNFHGLHNLL